MAFLFRKLKSSFSLPENRAIFLVGILILIFFTSLNWNAWAKDVLQGNEKDQLVPSWEGEIAKNEISKVIRLPEIRAKKIIAKKETVVSSTSSSELTGPAVYVSAYDYHTQADLKNVFNELDNAGIKTIFFQVRNVADAYYHSSYEPWAESLTGVLGRDPGWDPLNFAIKEAQKRKMHLYAWMNVYTIWRGETAPGNKNHLYFKHRDWIVYEKDKGKMQLNPGYLYISPGNPNVNQYLKKICLDIAARYRVDGLLLDQLVYPSSYYSYDSVSLNRFRAQNDLNWEDFRIIQISNFVSDLRSDLKERGLKIKLGASVYGRYPEGRSEYGQDSVYWVKHNWVNFIAPLIEWNLHDNPRFDTQVKDFKNRVGTEKLCIGISAYQFGNSFTEISNQVKVVQKYQLRNFAFYAYRHLKGRWSILKNLID